jgi:hypothetical protein
MHTRSDQRLSLLCTQVLYLHRAVCVSLRHMCQLLIPPPPPLPSLCVCSKYFHNLSVVDFCNTTDADRVCQLEFRTKVARRPNDTLPAMRGIKADQFTAFQDHNMAVTPVFVVPDQFESPLKPVASAATVHGTTQFNKPFADSVRPTVGCASEIVVCYICKLADVPGKFDMKKAAQLGIKPGPLCGNLTRGERYPHALVPSMRAYQQVNQHELVVVVVRVVVRVVVTVSP